MAIPPSVTRVLLFAALLGVPRWAQGQTFSQDSAAVLSAAQTLLKSINTRDTSLARPLLLPGGVFVSIRQGANGSTPRVQTHADFLSSLPTGNGRFLERIWSPRITIEGTLAEVRAPYDFHVDGKFSHCGVDVFTLVKATSGWMISGTSYTVQQTGCAPSPLGPPA